MMIPSLMECNAEEDSSVTRRTGGDVNRESVLLNLVLPINVFSRPTNHALMTSSLYSSP